MKQLQTLFLLLTFCLGPASFANPTPWDDEHFIAKAINKLSHSNGHVLLQNRLDFTAQFDQDGFVVSPEKSDLKWRWQLLDMYVGKHHILEATTCSEPSIKEGIITYSHGSIQEVYIPHTFAVEQQFILHERPSHSNEDLIIEGIVLSDGDFQATGSGWTWENATGNVTLGNVYVYDAGGKAIPAHMEVGENLTRISVNGQALAAASYPVTIDPKVGTNEFIISQLSTGGFSGLNARWPDIAYNDVDNEYLVVWEGGVDTVLSEREIWGQRLDGNTSAFIGSRFRVSTTGPNGSSLYRATTPAVAWSSTSRQYLVVWSGDDDSLTLRNQSEIWGQFLSDTCSLIGPTGFRISFSSPGQDASRDAIEPAVSWNSINNNFLVVWSADTSDNKNEIFGQMMIGDGLGNFQGSNFQISFTGIASNTNLDARGPDVTYNSAANEYLVAWYANLPKSMEYEIHVRRYNASFGSALDTAKVISDMGVDSSVAYYAHFPSITCNPDLNQYLVVWQGTDTLVGLPVGEVEIYGQLLDHLANETGTNDFRISNIGLPGDLQSGAFLPDVTYSSFCQKYMVAFYGDSSGGSYSNGETEVFIHVVNSNGQPIGDDSTLSSAGPIGNASFDAVWPKVAAGPAGNEYTFVWSMIDDPNTAFELYGQRFACQLTCPTSFGTDSIISCDSIVWIDGNTYYSSNDSAQFTITAGASSGCDSVVSLDLTIKKKSTRIDAISDCGPFTWIDGNTYTRSDSTAQYVLTGAASNGCDSIITLYLTIDTADVSITNNSPTLIANAIGATYQWINCDSSLAPINGATSQSLTPAVNGNYAVIVTQNGCVDTSDCVSIQNVAIGNMFERSLNLFPNPSKGSITLTFAAIPNQHIQLRLLDLNGKELAKSLYRPTRTIKENFKDIAKGIYFLEIASGDQSVVRKLMIE